jgi:hypothetical protein
MKRDRRPRRKSNEGVILLEDLTPRTNPMGGAGDPSKMVFGGGPVDPGSIRPDRRRKKAPVKEDPA